MSAIPAKSVCLHKEFTLHFRLLRLVFFLFCSLYAFTLWAGATLEELKFGSPKMLLPSLNGAVFQAERIAGTDLGERVGFHGSAACRDPKMVLFHSVK